MNRLAAMAAACVGLSLFGPAFAEDDVALAQCLAKGGVDARLLACRAALQDGGLEDAARADALFARADLLFWTGEDAAAKQDADAYLRLRPDDPKGFFLRGEIRLAMDRLSDAARDFDEALRLDPKFADALKSRALVRTFQGNHARAAQDLTTLLSLRPDDRETLRARAASYTAMNDMDGALSDLSALIRLFPDAAEYRYDRGYLHLLHGSMAPALADLEAAVTRDPDSDIAAEYYNDLAWTLAVAPAPLRDTRRAIAMAETALKIRDQARFHATLGAAHAAAGDPAGALIAYENALLRNPKLAASFQRGLQRWRFYRGGIDGDFGRRSLEALEKCVQQACPLGRDLPPGVDR